MRPNRRDVLWGLGGIALGSTTALAVPRSERFEVEEHQVIVPRLAEAHDGLRVVQITDLHVGTMTPDARFLEAARAITALQPDLIVLTGDFITVKSDPVERVSTLLTHLPDVPKLAVLGNHDHWTHPGKVSSELDRSNIELLSNEHTVLSLKGADLRVVGVDDSTTRHDDAATAFKGVPDEAPALVLTHTPSAAARFPARGDLVVAGHTHGGHFHIPGITEQVFRVVKEPWYRGWYDVSGNQLYVNRGLGAGGAGHFPRLDSIPEVSVFTLRGARTS